MRRFRAKMALSAASPLRLGRRTLLVSVGVLGFHAPGAASNPPPDPPRFEVTQATLSEAAEKAAELLHRRILLLKLYPSDPARKIKVSLSMVVKDHEDVLNALTAAFGLRWLDGIKPGEVVLVDKQDYQSTEAGLRHSVAEAMPPELRPVVLSPLPKLPSPEALEQPLKALEDNQPQQLALISARGWVQIRQLEPALARPLLEFLAGQKAGQLVRALAPLIQFVRKEDMSAPPLFYHSPPGDGPTFHFRIGDHEFGMTPGV